jgi:hypothetical protein
MPESTRMCRASIRCVGFDIGHETFRSSRLDVTRVQTTLDPTVITLLSLIRRPDYTMCKTPKSTVGSLIPFPLSLVVGFAVEQKRVIGHVLDILPPLGFSRLVDVFVSPYIFLLFHIFFKT